MELDILPELVEGFAANIVAYAALLAAIATVTMALLELVKAVLRLRLSYHRRMVREWIGDERRYEELLVLTVAGVDSAGALFDQPTDRMMGQIQSATNVVMDFPMLYPELYEFLTGEPSSAAAARETELSGKTRGKTSDAEVWREFAIRLEASDGEGGAGAPPLEGIGRATRARTRLDHFVTRRLDAFQTRTEYIWARANQVAAVVGAAVFILVLLVRVGIEASGLQAFFLASFGGMVAPFAKDVMTALSGLRARR